MSASVLELKIKALVEGLANVTSLAKELTSVGDAAKTAGGDAVTGKAGFDAMFASAEAYRALGIRSEAQIRDEITKTRLAYRELSESGKLSSDEQQRASAALKNKLAELNAELTGSGKNSKAAAEGFDGMNTPLGLLKDNVGKLIGAFTALALAYGIKESVDYAARTETLGITMNVVAKNAGYSAQEIGKYEKEVRGLGITTQATREAITQMIQAGLEIGPKAESQVSQVARLARAAQDLAVVTGENSSATLTRLITNIQQLDTVGLRYMGLTVNVEEAEKQFAISIGKTVDQLSQKQKMQGVMDAALRESAKLEGAYEASMESVGKKVQSLKRYQEELANDIGSKLLPAYGALVDSVTAFLKKSDETIRSIDENRVASKLFAEGVKDASDATGNLGVRILEVFKEITPGLAGTGKGLLDLLGLVIDVAGEILTLGHYTDAAGNKFTVLGTIVNGFLVGVSFLLAGLRDAVTVVQSLFYLTFGALVSLIGHSLVALGKLVAYISDDTGKAMQQLGEDIKATGTNLRDFAEENVAAMGRGEGAVGKYTNSLMEASAATERLKAITNFSQAEESIRKLAEAKRSNTITDIELAKSSADLVAKFNELGKAGALSADEIKKLNNELTKIGSDSKNDFIKAVDDMGLALSNLGGEGRLLPLEKDFQKVVGGLNTIADSAQSSAKQVQDAFNKGIDTAKTVADIGVLSDSLGAVVKRTGDLTGATQQLQAKFEEVFETKLKAAKTAEDFKLLSDEVEAVGKKGNISGSLLVDALDRIASKASGARDEIARLAKQADDLSRSAVDLAKAHLDMVKADVDVGRAKLEVMVKQNAYGREGTELARQELELAKINQSVAQAKAAEAKTQYEATVAANKVLIAQQQQLNSEKEYELHLGDEIYQQKKRQAEENAKDAQDVLENARAIANQQREATYKLEEQSVKQKFLVEQAKAAEEETRRIKMNMEGAASATGSAADQMRRYAAESQNVKPPPTPKPGPTDKGSDGFGGGATDSAIANLLWDSEHGVTIESNPENIKRAQTAFDAAAANLEVYQQYSGAFSNAGADSIMREYNRARTLLDKVKGAGLSDGGERGSGYQSDWGQYGFGMRRINGSHRDGLDRVPKDGYIAELHKDEKVLTAVEADQYRRAPSVADLSRHLLDQLSAASRSSYTAMAEHAAKAAASAPAPSKTIQVNFSDASGRTVPMTTAAGNEQSLLDLLARAKGVSA